VKESAVSDHTSGNGFKRDARLSYNAGEGSRESDQECVGVGGMRNKRDVWTIATQPYKGAHFAVFPEEIPRTCIKAGTSEKGVCPTCGAFWARKKETWASSCACAINPVPCIVLDPFAGSGTTLAVAKSLGRDYLGLELNTEYKSLIEERIRPAQEYQQQKAGFDAMLALSEEA